MKDVKIIFSLAFVALICAIAFFMAFLFAPEYVPQKEETVQEETVPVQDDKEQQENADEELKALAETEIKRFKDEYDMDITMEAMMKELKVRSEYEKTYGKSYDLEEVFLAEVPEDDSVGDEGDEDYDLVLQKIQKYVELYDVDERRYASMTAYEELAALEVEYGPLPEDALEETDVESSEQSADTDGQGTSNNVSFEIVDDGGTESEDTGAQEEPLEEGQEPTETEEADIAENEQEEQ